MKRYLAVDEFNEFWIEDSEAVVDYAKVNELPVRFFQIEVDEDGNPTLEEVV